MCEMRAVKFPTTNERAGRKRGSVETAGALDVVVVVLASGKPDIVPPLNCVCWSVFFSC